jgi:type II secretory pathway pseudopilin PulG
MKARHAKAESGPGRRDPRERGYALIALLALMTLLMIAMMAAAPSIRQQSRRELELEAIARGEEVAEAIRMYIRINPTHQPPNSMDELLEGAPTGLTKKAKVLRASAARDPLSESGEWRTVKLRDEALVRFIRDITEYADGRPPTATTDQTLTALAQQLPQLTGLVTGLGSGSPEGSGGEDGSLSSSGPFIGVTSRSRRDSIVTYYGIDRHDRWVFTPFYR